MIIGLARNGQHFPTRGESVFPGLRKERTEKFFIMKTIRFRLTKQILTFALFASSLLLTTSASAVDTLPILWQAGGLTAGNDGAGQAARIATDASGNVAVVSGPSMAKDLAVTSYTSAGVFRWQSVISPSSGTFQGDWVAAAPNGDFVAVGHTLNSSGNPIAISLVRFGSNGAFQWRVDPGGLFPSVGRLSWIPAATPIWPLTSWAMARTSSCTNTARRVHCSGRK